MCVANSWCALISTATLTVRVALSIHADELLALVSVPPGATFDNLSHTCVIIARADKETEIVTCDIGFGSVVF